MYRDIKIPEYALQPAKEIIKSPCQGLFKEKEYNCYLGCQKKLCTFEEDILVPDVNPDMMEILLMSGDVSLSPSERVLESAAEESMNLRSVISLQTVYKGLDEINPIPINSQLFHNYQWKITSSEPTTVFLSGHIKDLTYSIINERKFRVKICLVLEAEIFARRKFEFFEGIKDSNLQTMRKPCEIERLLFSKRDELSINHLFSCKVPNGQIESIIKSRYWVIENYRQLMKDKIVINGFIYAKYLCKSEEGALFSHDEKVEFTQFIPMGKSHKVGDCSTSKATYSLEDFATKMNFDDEAGQKQMSLQGRIKTRVDVYDKVTETIVCDAYDLSKSFQFSKRQHELFAIIPASTREITVRKLFSLDEGSTLNSVIYCEGYPKDTLANATVLWADENENIHRSDFVLEYMAEIAEFTNQGSDTCEVLPNIKHIQADKAGDHQIEITLNIQFTITILHKDILTLICEPCFVDGGSSKDYPVAIVKKDSSQTLWELAKTHHTTVEAICLVNGIEADDSIEKRLLIVK